MASVSKEALLKIVGDDTDAEEKLDRISAKADKLREEHPELTVRIDTAEATAKLAVFREELKAATRSMTVDVDERAGKGGLLTRLLYGSDFAEGGGGGTGEVGGLAGALPEFLSGPMLVGIAAAIPLLFALMAELTGLIAGFAALGAGAVAFAALAYPAFEAVKNAMGDTAAQLKKLSPDERGAVLGIRDLEKGFQSLSKAFEPEVFKVFNDALQVANDLLPTLSVPATDFADAIAGLLKKLDKFTTSPGFQKWLQKFDNLIGPATTAIGKGVGKLAGAFGNLLTTMSAHDVVHTINIAFDILSGTINVISDVVKRLMHNWDEMSGAFQEGFKDISKWIAPAISNFETLGGSFQQLWRNIVQYSEDGYHDISGIFATVGRIFTSDIPQWLSDGVAFFQRLPGDIVSAVGNLGGLLVHAGESIIDGLVSGIKSAASGALHDALSWVTSLIPSWKGPMSTDQTLLEPSGRAIMGGLVTGITGSLPQLQSALSHVTSSIGVGLGGGGGGGGGGLGIQLSLAGGTGNQFEQLLLQSMRAIVLRNGGGGKNSVQRALGQTS